MKSLTNILRNAATLTAKALGYLAISPLLPIFAMMWLTSVLTAALKREAKSERFETTQPKAVENPAAISGPSWKQQFAQINLGSSLDLKSTWSH